MPIYPIPSYLTLSGGLWGTVFRGIGVVCQYGQRYVRTPPRRNGGGTPRGIRTAGSGLCTAVCSNQILVTPPWGDTPGITFPEKHVDMPHRGAYIGHIATRNDRPGRAARPGFADDELATT